MNKVLKNLKNNFLEYGFYILIFLLPWQTRWMFKLGELNGGYWEYGTMSLYGVDIFLIGLLIFSLTSKEIQFPIGNWISKKIWWFIGGLELFIFISIFFASDLNLALYGYIKFLLAIGLFFLVSNLKYDKIKLYWSLILAGVIQSALAMQQFATQRVFASKWLGMAFQNPENLGVSVIDTGIRRWLRAYGSLPHPNILGGFLVVVLLINIFLYFNLHKKFLKAVEEKAIKKYKIGLLLSLVFFILNFIGLLLTFSRSAWLGFGVGLIILLILETQKYKYAFAYLMKFVFIIVIVSSLFAWGLKEPLSTRFNLNNRLEDKSVTERINYNQDAWKIIKNNWLFGAGIKNYGLAVHNEINSERSVYEYEPVHNVFLLIWAEIGIFGFFCFFAFLFFCLWQMWQKRDYSKIVLIASIITIMMFDHWIWSFSMGMYLMWLIIGIAYKKN